MKNKFIDINKEQPKLGELVIVKLRDEREIKCFRCGCKDEHHNGWAEAIIGAGINIDVVGWKYI